MKGDRVGLEKNREGGNGCLLKIKSYFLKLDIIV